MQRQVRPWCLRTPGVVGVSFCCNDYGVFCKGYARENEKREGMGVGKWGESGGSGSGERLRRAIFSQLVKTGNGPGYS